MRSYSKMQVSKTFVFTVCMDERDRTIEERNQRAKQEMKDKGGGEWVEKMYVCYVLQAFNHWQRKHFIL